MNQIALSCMIQPSALHLHGFEMRHRVQVQVDRLEWGTAWDRLLRVALHGQGPDVSEIGSTWLGSLVDMEAIRPLADWADMYLDSARFFPAARWAITRPGDARVWAVPLLTDTRAIYYRRDWLEKAGIDESTAFASPGALFDTLARLQAYGFDTPWAMPTRELDVLYTAASFVWGAGGHFRAPDGRHFRLGEPETLAGLRTFFDLHSFLSPAARGLDIAGTNNLFQRGESAAALSGPWLLATLSQDARQLAQVGVACVPGVPFIGGTHLVIWRHGRNEWNIVKLMQYLTSAEIQRRCVQETGNLPARFDILNGAPFANDPGYRAFAESLKMGRVLAASYRWAAVERRLVELLSGLWSDLAADPDLNLDAEIERRVTALTEELERTILASW